MDRKHKRAKKEILELKNSMTELNGDPQQQTVPSRRKNPVNSETDHLKLSSQRSPTKTKTKTKMNTNEENLWDLLK